MLSNLPLQRSANSGYTPLKRRIAAKRCAQWQQNFGRASVPGFRGRNLLYNKIFNFFHLMCHQKPERSFFIGNTQLFLCSRCTGIYLSIIVIFLLYPFINFKQTYRLLYSLLAIALLLNFLTYITIFDTNSTRFILGSLIGIPSGLILIKSIKNIFKKGE